VLAFLRDRGLALPAAAYRPFIELRCPVVGTLQAGDVFLEVRNALEPWPVLRFEAATRRAQRFTGGAAPWPLEAAPTAPRPDAPYTLDLRRYPIDRPPPRPPEADES
jgi:uncharacterized protein (DUF2126 family)